MLKIRRPLGRLIFNMGIAIPGKTVFLIETAPSMQQRRMCTTQKCLSWRSHWLNMAKLPLPSSNTILTHSKNCNPHNLTKCWLINVYARPLLHARPHMGYMQNDLEFKVISRSYQSYFKGYWVCVHNHKCNYIKYQENCTQPITSSTQKCLSGKSQNLQTPPAACKYRCICTYCKMTVWSFHHYARLI